MESRLDQHHGYTKKAEQAVVLSSAMAENLSD